jgi:hypothetical protein
LGVADARKDEGTSIVAEDIERGEGVAVRGVRSMGLLVEGHGSLEVTLAAHVPVLNETIGALLLLELEVCHQAVDRMCNLHILLFFGSV